MALFLQQLANGLTIGAIYALIALGYTMVYGVIQLINFAHGEVFIVGAYVTLTVLSLLGLRHPLGGAPLAMAVTACVVCAMAGCSLLGLGMERFAYRPVRHSSRLNALITAIGMSFVLQNALMLFYGATDRRVPSIIPSVRWEIGGASVTLLQVVIWACSALVMAGLQALVMSTTLGKAMRAAAQDPKACRLLGIPVDRVIAVTFIIGSSLAAVGGCLFGLYYNTVNFHDGYLTGLKAFTAAVLGGIGNLPGAMLGGLVLGLVEGLAAGYISSQWKNVVAFVVLVALLMFKPTGLLGERVADRA